jgi:hypothetical protein
MALLKNAEFKGIKINGAYHRVWNVYVTKDEIEFGLGFHVDANSERINSLAYKCAYNLAGDNPIKQAYLYLKTLPEFAGAVDC